MDIKSQHYQVYSHVCPIPPLAAYISRIFPTVAYLCSPLAKVRSLSETTGQQAQIIVRTKGTLHWKAAYRLRCDTV